MHTLDATASGPDLAFAISLLPTPTEAYRGAPLLPEEFRPDPLPADEVLIEECIAAQQRLAIRVGVGVTGFILGAAAAILA